ncbi:MAG: 50S ribosomal protein L18 [Pseudobacteriovorax sp.]|nr:50S ribosomal protein L18 [Pseudobacteriovorax sp.]
MGNANKKTQLRLKRKRRIRKKVSGTAERPRLSVFRSARHLYAQVIDDQAGKTLASVNSFEKGSDKRANKDVCTDLGKKLAAECASKNISSVVFDKNGYAFHGRVEAFASGAREAGLKF